MKKLLIALVASCACALYAHDHDHDHDHDHEAHAHHHHEDDHDHDHEHGHDHAHGEERGVEVSDAAAALIGLTTAPAQQRILEANLALPARVVQNPKALRTLSAQMGGFVTYTAAAPQVVAADARLFEFVSPEAAAKYGELQALEARAAALTTAGAKNAQLRTDLSVARVTYGALTNGLVVVSAEEGRFAQVVPCAGRIVGFEVASGSYVERGAPLARLRAEMTPCARACVPVAEASDLRDGLAASVVGEPGTILVDRTRSDGLVDVWFVANESSRVLTDARIGENVSLEIKTSASGESVVAVPSSSVFRDGITPMVLVRDEHDADRFVVHPVTPGRTVNGWTEVEGLEPGAEVVVQGLYELRQALPSSGEKKRAAGHFHADGKFHAGGHDEE